MLTLRNKMPVVIPIMKSALATIFGRRNGNLVKNLLFPKSAGIFSAGLAKKPPNDGPKMEPKLQTRGIIENALGCSSFSGTISATIVRIIPTADCQQLLPVSRARNSPFPLHAPASALAMIAIGRLIDIPHIRLHIMVHVKPKRIVGFRPNMSEALPQMIAVVHCDNEKTADVIPAHLATFFSSMPKLSIISGCHVMSVEG